MDLSIKLESIEKNLDNFKIDLRNADKIYKHAKSLILSNENTVSAPLKVMDYFG
jgi:sRNA-binding regulator protein Hfq